MKKILCIGFVILAFNLFAQDTISVGESFIEKELVFNKNTNELFTSIIQNKNRKKVKSELHYIDGRLRKEFFFYNTKKQAISEEFNYFENGKLEKTIKYHSTGMPYLYRYYNQNDEFYLEEFYKNDRLESSIEFKNGKKHGKQFCYDSNGIPITIYFENGKQIK